MGIIMSVSWMKKCSSRLGAELSLHVPTGRLQLSAKKNLFLKRQLAQLLWFPRCMFEPGKIYIAAEPHRLAVHREICVHLAEVSTSENLHNGRPSTLLRSVPVENERCGGGRTETFPCLQYKQLASGPLSQLTLMVLDVKGKEFDHLSVVLHIRNGWGGWPWKHQILIVLGFNDTSTLEGHFVSSPREREKRDRRESRGDEREGQGRKRNRNESEETEEINSFPLYPYPLQG